MTPEERSMLEQTLKLSQENNQLLHSMKRSASFDRTMRILYWAVIILLSIAAFFGFQTYLGSINISSLMQQPTTLVNTIK
jgi:hypothetical protein